VPHRGIRALNYDLNLACDPHGMGDAMLGCWLASGTRHRQYKVHLHSADAKRSLIERFDAPLVDSYNHTFHMFHHDSKAKGSPPRLWLWAEKLGLGHIDAVQPTHDFSAEEAQAAHERAGNPEVLLFPESMHGVREWPLPYWRELIDKFGSVGVSMSVIGIRKRCGLKGYIADMTWVQSAAAMLNTKLVIGMDSGPVHVAGTLGVKALAILGPTNDGVFAHCDSVHCLSAPKRLVPCAGCHYIWDYIPGACEFTCSALANITPDIVFEKSMDMLNESSSS
jgi:ADP-heptose:LPS heptosyltransferase